MLLILLTLNNPCQARTLQTAEDIALAKKARTLYAHAQNNWQKQFAELVSSAQPDLHDIATLAMSLQLAQTELRSKRFFYLLETEPDKLDINGDLQAFANFPWSTQQETALLGRDSAYMALEKQIFGLHHAHNNHPDWAQFRHYYQQTLVNDKKYQDLVAQFKQRLETIAKILLPFKTPAP